jgi:hypothetical protein
MSELGLGVFTQPGSSTDLTAPKCDFRYAPESRLNSDIAPCPERAKRRHSLCATSKVEIGPPWAARTLADLDNAQKVGRSQLAEAPSYHALVHHVRFGARRCGHPMGIRQVMRSRTVATGQQVHYRQSLRRDLNATRQSI